MILRAEALCRQFIRDTGTSNVFTAVEKTDFTLAESAMTVLMGRSGSGKSTFVSMLAGLLTPTDGRVLLGDTDLYALDDTARSRLRNQHFGFVPQGQSAIYALTVLENILMPAQIYGEQEGRMARAKTLMESLDIASLKDAYPRELSGGELRRVAIARALIMEPEIVFADEPTGDLDDENTAVVFETLKALTENGTSVLIVTHENEAARYADRMYAMTGGRLTPYTRA